MAESKALHVMPLFVKDILSDGYCRGLNDADFGRYIRLLMQQWVDGDLPADPSAVIRTCSLDPDCLDAVTLLIATKFSDRANTGRIRNARAHQEREIVVAKVLKASESGRLGGRPIGKRTLNPSESERFSGAKPTYSDSDSGLDSVGGKEECRETIGGSAAIDGCPLGAHTLQSILDCFPAGRRGRPIPGRNAVQLALDAISRRADVSDPVEHLRLRTLAYAASPQGKGDRGVGAAKWFTEGGYDQQDSDWSKPYDFSNGHGQPLAVTDETRAMIQRGIAASREVK